MQKYVFINFVINLTLKYPDKTESCKSKNSRSLHLHFWFEIFLPGTKSALVTHPVRWLQKGFTDFIFLSLLSSEKS